MIAQPTIDAGEWAEFQQAFLLKLLKDPQAHFGRMFCAWFPDTLEPLAENSNLGTPPGVYHPNDDVILAGIKNAKEGISFVTDRIDIV